MSPQRPKKRPPTYYPVSVEKNGVTYEGTYTVQAGMVEVFTTLGHKGTQQGNSPAEVIAQRLLSEIVGKRHPGEEGAGGTV
jgi:hypothetical protein